MASFFLSCCRQVLPNESQGVIEGSPEMSIQREDEKIETVAVDEPEDIHTLPRCPAAKTPDALVANLPVFDLGDTGSMTTTASTLDGSSSLRLNSISNWSELDSQCSPRTSSFSARSSQPDVSLWTVAISKAHGESLGLTLDTLDGTSLLISEVLDGAIRNYNEATPDIQQRVQPGDSLVAVGRASGSCEVLISRLRYWKEAPRESSQEELELILQRPRAFTVNIQRAYRPLGLQLDHTGGGTGGLLVQAVTPGLLRDWNVAQRSLAVKRLDRIVRVNGMAGSSEKLLEKIKVAATRGQKLELEVHRFAPWEQVLRRLESNADGWGAVEDQGQELGR
eukprot:TRINITY_DN6397_c0_g1_i1.p1 TRINITY_DN6397_c0_g1~~TRINITY_DN6397_c0_g1_i1.p1  ORF type:complete len:358 (-),score=77.68 TRINITY_DN6397_c0_g1_i1:240-1250(-)